MGQKKKKSVQDYYYLGLKMLFFPFSSFLPFLNNFLPSFPPNFLFLLYFPFLCLFPFPVLPLPPSFFFADFHFFLVPTCFPFPYFYFQFPTFFNFLFSFPPYHLSFYHSLSFHLLSPYFFALISFFPLPALLPFFPPQLYPLLFLCFCFNSFLYFFLTHLLPSLCPSFLPSSFFLPSFLFFFTCSIPLSFLLPSVPSSLHSPHAGFEISDSRNDLFFFFF